MKRHTPGPWTSVSAPTSSHDSRWILGDEQKVVARVPWEGEQDERLANARLVAAAPDLLAALESLFEHCVMMHKHWGDGCNRKQADEAQSAGVAAIAKAKGGV